MENLLINPKSKNQLGAYLNEPTHALLLTGQKGVGLGTIAKALAKQIAGAEVVVVVPKLHKSQKTANINTDDIRALREFTRAQRTVPLAIVIDEAETMTNDAPGALLKNLEEPSSNIHFILTSHNTSNLPETITSRVQNIEILPVHAENIISDIKPQLKQRQIEFMAGNLPAEIHRLSEDELYFRSQARLFEQAKEFILANTYERLRLVSKFKLREETLEFLVVLSHLTQIKPSKSKSLETLSAVIDNLNQNGNVKAQLTYLATSY